MAPRLFNRQPVYQDGWQPDSGNLTLAKKGGRSALRAGSIPDFSPQKTGESLPQGSRKCEKDHPKSFTNWNFGTLFSDRNSFQERISSMSWYLVVELDGLWFNGLWNNPIPEAYEKILLNITNDSISSPFSLQQPVSPFFIPSPTPRNSLLENHRDQSVVRLWKISLLIEARTMGHSQVFIRSCTNENLTCLVIQSGKKIRENTRSKL